MKRLIQKTEYENLDIITANMKLLKANLEVMLDQQRPQQNRLEKALASVAGEYDFCIIDNAPDINISTINALVASDDVIVPLEIDDNTTEGLPELVEQVENVKEDLNEHLTFRGCLVTKLTGRTKHMCRGKNYCGSGNIRYLIVTYGFQRRFLKAHSTVNLFSSIQGVPQRQWII